MGVLLFAVTRGDKLYLSNVMTEWLAYHIVNDGASVYAVNGPAQAEAELQYYMAQGLLPPSNPELVEWAERVIALREDL